VDGVAIHGVSGGPAFTCIGDKLSLVCGVVTAYWPNITAQGALPGVCRIVDPKPYYAGLQQMETFDDFVRGIEEKTKQDAKGGSQSSNYISPPDNP